MNAPQDLPVAKDQVIAIHDVAIARFGGLPGVRDEGLLDSALAQPWQTFGGRDLYEGDVAKACRLRYDVIRDHPFTDGNKRTGAALLGASLRLCGHHFKPRHDDFLRATLAVADGSMSYEQLVEWVEKAVS